MVDIIQEAPAVFFKERLEEAVRHQRIVLSDEVMFYAVSLLSSINNRGFLEESLGVSMMRALERSAAERLRLLRTIGDAALLISGFWSDSLRRKLVDVDYYVGIGVRAYGVLGAQETGSSGELFQELSSQFVPLSEAMMEVSERFSLTDVRNILAMYERWQKTRSPRLAKRLAEMGIHVVPVSSKAQ